MPSFSAPIIKLGVNPLVNVPVDVLNKLFVKAGKDKSPIPIMGKLNGKPYKQTMVKYEGEWRLHLNNVMLKAAGIDVGDIAHVQINFDSEPRITTMHPKLKQMFAETPKTTFYFHYQLTETQTF